MLIYHTGQGLGCYKIFLEIGYDNGSTEKIYPLINTVEMFYFRLHFPICIVLHHRVTSAQFIVIGI